MLERINLFNLRRELRLELRKRGYGVAAIASVIGAVDEPTIKECGTLMGVEAIGDGSILRQLIDAFLEFLRSEQGQALIAALLKLLLGLLAI